MRNYSFLLILLLSIYTSVIFAQGVKDAKFVRSWAFGAQGGFNFVKLQGEIPIIETETSIIKITDINRMLTLSLGVNAEYKFEKNASIQMSLMYLRAGSDIDELSYIKNEVGIVDLYQNYRYRLDYINVPIHMRYYIYDLIYAEAGGYISFLFSAENTKDYHYSGSTEIAGTSVFDVGGSVGVGFLYLPWKIGVRYMHGLLPAIEHDDIILKNRVIQLYFAMDINKKQL